MLFNRMTMSFKRTRTNDTRIFEGVCPLSCGGLRGLAISIELQRRPRV
jgi:hypothetical protein